MSALDRYEPPTEKDDRDWLCFDCKHCVQCDIVGHYDIGWCDEFEVFVTDSDTASDSGCA